MQIPQYKVFGSVQKQRFWPRKVLLRSQKSCGFGQRHLIFRKSTKIIPSPHTDSIQCVQTVGSDGFPPEYSCEGLPGVSNAFLSTQLIVKHFPRARNTARRLTEQPRARTPSISARSRHFGGLGPSQVLLTRSTTVVGVCKRIFAE